ncbi:hypothetical protein FRC05_009735 [Tulasnella sp. 425]|nr:hypothetical protein FRC05_009735 [Tulasnella sp. 425]
MAHLILQPQLFTALAALSWAQCLYYGQKRTKLFTGLSYLTFMSLFAGIQTGLVFAFKAARNERALQAFGILSAVIISVGLISRADNRADLIDPNTWKFGSAKKFLASPSDPMIRKQWILVDAIHIGISMLFMAVDMGGGLFSVLSLVFKPKFDGVAAATYLAVITLDGVIVVAALILNPRAKKRRERQVSGTETAGSIAPGSKEKEPQATATHVPVEP